MVKKVNLKNLLTMMMVAFLNFAFFSCSSEDDVKLDDGSSNTTDVAVTSNVSKLGVTYAHIDGYVNLNLITSSYTSQQIGIELAMSEDFVNAKQAKSKELEGNKLTVKIDTLSSQTKYYYRTFVIVNDLAFYGEKRSFTTKDLSNIISAGDASDLTFSSAKIRCQGDTSLIDKEDKISIGIAYSTSQTILHPDSAYNVYYGYYYNGNNPKGFNVAECSMDSLIKNKSFEVSLTRLQTETRYYYCSFTRAGKKYKLGEVKSFTTNTLSDAQLSTGDATDITFTSATIQNTSSIASLYPEGTYIQYGIKYGISNDALNSYAYATSQEGNTFTVQIRNLKAGQIYYYCAYASVDGVVLTGETKSFTTNSGDSYLSTEDATEVTLTSAKINGKTTLSSLYTNKESNIRYNIRYSKNRDYINDTNGYYYDYYDYGNYNTVTANKDGNNLSATLSKLQSSTTYYFCVVAYVDDYYICGDVKSFTTKSETDYLKTVEASDITMTSATLKGASTLSTIYPSSTNIQYYIRYATSSSNLTSSYNSSSVTVTKNGNNLTGTATNLKSETTYYYCVVAYIEGLYIYGETKNFTTKSGADYLKAGEASNITITSAIVKGTTTLASVYSNNTTIQYRIVYGTSNSSLTSSSNSSVATPELSGTTLTAELTNLVMATTYYYCVRASVNGSYYYSDIKSFTTNDIPTSGYVDLGVSCKWASCNLGATTPQNIGNLYAWGETGTKSVFNIDSYSYYHNNIGNDISNTDYDAAKANLGSPWRMPTSAEYKELLNQCFWQEVTYKESKGYMVTGKNGNVIFLPKNGNTYQYWTSTEWHYTYDVWPGTVEYAATWEGTQIGHNVRYAGLPIRPVR